MYALISDLHSNLEALNAVIDDIKVREIADIFFLGDAVGYGPDPDRCVEIVSESCRISIAGNHDHAAAGLISTASLNKDARKAVEWTRSVIKRESLDFLRALELSRQIEDEILLVHSTPVEPGKWHYILDMNDAEISFRHFTQKICAVGHSHIPLIMECLPSGELKLCSNNVMPQESARYIVNTGSVGQPRDGDPRASYAVIADNGIEIVRIEYNYKVTQEKILKAGLPAALAARLE